MSARRRREVETDQYAAFARRIMRAFGRRVANGDPLDLAELVAIRDEMDQVIVQAVRGMRETHGYSWAEIARDLGTSRQNAQKVYGRKIERLEATA